MIRKLNLTDMDIVMSIWLESNINTHNFIPKEYWQSNSDMVKRALSASEVYVYQKDDKVIGFIGFSDNYIEGVFVKESERSHGIGSQLLDYAKQIKSSLTLHVYKKNIRAVNFYKRENFEITDIKTDINTNQVEFEMLWSRE